MSNWKVKETEEVNGESEYFVYRLIDGTKPDDFYNCEFFTNEYYGMIKLFKHRDDAQAFADKLNENE